MIASEDFTELVVQCLYGEAETLWALLSGAQAPEPVAVYARDFLDRSQAHAAGLPNDLIDRFWSQCRDLACAPEIGMTLRFYLAMTAQDLPAHWNECSELAIWCQEDERPAFRVMPYLLKSDVQRQQRQALKIPTPGYFRRCYPFSREGLGEPLLTTSLSLFRGSDPRLAHQVEFGARAMHHMVNGSVRPALEALEQLEDALGSGLYSDVSNCLPMGWIMEQVLSGILALDPNDIVRQVRALDFVGDYADDIEDFMRLPIASSQDLERCINRPHAESLANSTNGLVCYNPIRACLVLGDLEGARVLLTQRRKSRAIIHFLDHLFWMRLSLATRELDQAAHHYRLLLDASDYFLANRRIEYELRVAREMSLQDFARMMNSMGQEEQVGRGNRQRAPQLGGLIGTSQLMTKVRKRIRLYADQDLPVLVLGETGTGKDLVARALHEASARSAEPYVAVNCAAFSDTLLQAELFGYERGSFTGADRQKPGLIAAAGAGTLFLDEIGDTSPQFQSALLRLLENREYRPVGGTGLQAAACRIVAATNVDLPTAVAQGAFRADLLHRLERLSILLPPLRERREDVPDLAQHFLAQHLPVRPQLHVGLLRQLQRQEWPGNVRELRNRMELMAVHHPGVREFHKHHFADVSDTGASDHPARDAGPAEVEPGVSVSEADRDRRRDDVAASSGSGGESGGGSIERTPGGSPRPAAGLGLGTDQMARLSRLRSLFVEHRILTPRQIRAVLGCSSATATRDLRALVAEGVIEKVMPTGAPRTHYYQWCEVSG